MFAVGLGLFVAASAACALAPTIGWLIAARAAQGVGRALVVPLAMSLLSAAFPPQERAKALGIFSGVTGLALIAGPVVGGAIAEGLAWQWIFWLNVPIGLIVIPLVLRRVPESSGTDTALDIGGLVLVTGASFAAVWGLMRGNGAGWSSVEVVVALAAGIAAGGGVRRLGVARPRADGADAALPLARLRSRAMQRASSCSRRFMAPCSSWRSSCKPPRAMARSAPRCDCYPGPPRCSWLLRLRAPSSTGSASDRSSSAGCSCKRSGWPGSPWSPRPHLVYAELVAPLIVSGAGASMAMPASQNAVLNAVAKSEIGKASGTFNMLRFLGGVFGIALLVAAFAGTGSVASPEAFSAGFARAIGVAAALSLSGAVAGLWLPSVADLTFLTSVAAKSFVGTSNPKPHWNHRVASVPLVPTPRWRAKRAASAATPIGARAGHSPEAGSSARTRKSARSERKRTSEPGH